ncbi:MAG: hypothetical protein ABR572_03675 [Cryomorphaceae bacterium]
MDKKFLPLLGLISLGIGFAACLLVYSLYTDADAPESDDDSAAVKSRYEMPHFVPVVRAAM